MSREKPPAFFDIDKTLIDGLAYFTLIDQLKAERFLDPRSDDRGRMVMEQFEAGAIGYEALIKDLLDVYAVGLQGQSVEKLQALADRFYDESPYFFAYAEPTIDALRPSHEVILVTGSPQFVAKAVAKNLGVRRYASTRYAMRDDYMTGHVVKYLATRQEKGLATMQHLNRRVRGASCAFGDSDGDIEMLRAVRHAFCVQPSGELAVLAAASNWPIIAAEEVAKPAVPQVVRDTLHV